MEKIRCECGHENPYGTKLCAVCGLALTTEEKGQKFADMRYDGTAIRSKTYNKSIIDKIWNFFSSVKIGITLIILNLVAASIGTLFPQEFNIATSSEAEQLEYYQKMYGTAGKIYYELGLSNVYNSWWFQILVGLLGISIIVASLDRGLPLHKSLKNQRVKRHVSFMKRQRVVSNEDLEVTANDQTLQKVTEALQKAKYNVRQDGQAILAEKGRFARYGPYINHLGLIVFLTGVMLRIVPGMYSNESMWISEGEILAVPGMEGYYIENKKFIFETYDNEPQGEQVRQGVNAVAKNYQTDVVLYKAKDGAVAGQNDDLEAVKEYEIQVNHPLKYKGYAFYQMDYRLGLLKVMKFSLVNKATGESLGVVDIDLYNPQREYVINDTTKVELIGYYPDFDGFDEGKPKTKTQNPVNPAFVFKMYTPETPDGETSFVALMQTLEPLGENKYNLKFTDFETFNKSGIVVHKNKTIPILFVGGGIFMLGVVIGSYFSHRRIWLEVAPDGKIRYAAHTNKNWPAIKKDLDKVIVEAGLPNYIDRYEEEKAGEGETTK